jgi:hypothetical protein
MKYKFQKGSDDPEMALPDTVMIGEENNIPDYDFRAPEILDKFGLNEFMEGVFEFPGRTIEDIWSFLNGIGYEEIP